MELNLNIYKNRDEIEKTYTTDTFRLWFGTIEDFAKLLNLDELKTGSDTEIVKLVGKSLFGSMDIVKDLFKDVFIGVTDEELRRTDVSEIASILVEIVKYTFSTLTKGVNAKN